LVEASLQAIDDLGFETAHVIRSFVSQATMKFFRKANADHPTPGVLHPPKASDASPNGDPDNQSGHGGKGDGHGDTPPIRNSTIMLMATLRTIRPSEASYDHIYKRNYPDGHKIGWPPQIIFRPSRIGSLLLPAPSTQQRSIVSRRAISLPISNQAHIWQSSSTATEGLSL
jgi:hypothetical protein